MDGLFVVHVDDSGLPLEVEHGRSALQARSLSNALKLCKRKLVKLSEEKVHTDEDLLHYQHALDLMESEVSGSKTDAACTQLLEDCRGLLREMQSTAEVLPDALRPTYTQLAELRRSLHRMQQRRDHTLQEVVPLQAQLDSIDADRVANGGFGGEAETQAGELGAGQHVCNELLNQCYELLADCLHTATDIPPAMQRVYNQLRRIKNALRRLSGKEHHTVEELKHYQALLEKIDCQGLSPQPEPPEAAVGDEQAAAGEAGDPLRGHEAAQALLKDCYDLIEGLMDSAEGLAPDAKAVHSKLEQYRHKLEGMTQLTHTYKELLDIQLALNAVDDDRQTHAGVFAGHASAGRACSALLNHCYRMLHELYGSATAGDVGP